jgi:hypothetical protein
MSQQFAIRRRRLGISEAVSLRVSARMRCVRAHGLVRSGCERCQSWRVKSCRDGAWTVRCQSVQREADDW